MTPEQFKAQMDAKYAAKKDFEQQMAAKYSSIATPPEVQPAGEVFGPQAVAKRSLRALQYAGGLGGGMLGGVPGAIIGGTTGKLAEQEIRARAFGQQRPSEGAEIGEMLGAGALQGGLEAVGQLPGLAAKGLRNLAAWNTGRIEKNVLGRVKATEVARDIRKPLEQAIKTAEARRSTSAAALRNTLQATQANPVTAAELADHIIAKLPPEVKIPARYRTKLIRDIAQRQAEVLKAYSLGAMNTKIPGTPASTILNEFGEPAMQATKAKFQMKMPLEQAQFAKQAFQNSAHPELGAIQRGILPKPDLDLALAGAYQDAIERRVPQAAAINQETRAAIKEVQRLKQASNSQKEGVLRQIMEQQRVNLALAQARNPMEREMIGVHLGLPGFAIRPPRLSQTANFLAGALGSAPANALAAGLPRTAALGLDLMREDEQP